MVLSRINKTPPIDIGVENLISHRFYRRIYSRKDDNEPVAVEN